MNDLFLDKFFNLYSIINRKFSINIKVPQYLVSYYYLKNSLLCPYEYIDFELMYRYDSGVMQKTILSNSNEIENFISSLPESNEYIEIAKFLYRIEYNIKHSFSNISDDDILKLNEIYRKII